MVMELRRKISRTLRAVTFAATILLVASAQALAQNLPPPGAYQPIPNFTGVGAGLQFREAINDRFSGAQPIAPSIASPAFANLPPEQDGMLLFCKDCGSATPCASGGSGAFAFGQGGLWSCAGAATAWPASLTQNLFTGGHAINGNTSSGGDQINKVSLNGVLNVQSFGAVCSNTTETATTTASNATITVGAIGDFKVGQYVKLDQAGASNTIATPTISSVALNAFGTNNGPRIAQICNDTASYICENPDNFCQTDTLTALPTHNATCTTEYCYTVQNTGQTGIGTGLNGMRSAQSAAVCVASGPSKLSVDNNVIVAYSVDANTVGTIIRGCTGSGACTPSSIVAVMPVDFLRNVPGTYYYADMGNHFGTDEDSIGGTAAVAADDDAQIVSISGTSVTLSNAPARSGTATMRHDNAPAFQAAVNASCQNGASNNCAPVFVPGCASPYPLSQAVSLWGLSGSGFVAHTGAVGEGANAQPVQLEWDGPIGGIVINGNYSGGTRIDGIAYPGGSGNNSPGIFIDIDRYPNSGMSQANAGPGAPASSATGVTTPTHWIVANTQCGNNVGLCYHLGGQSNVEDMTFTNNACDGSGGGGGWSCYFSSSQETYNEVINGGGNTWRDFGFNFGGIGGFQVRDQNMSANVVDFYTNTISNTGEIDGGVSENAQYFGSFGTATGQLRTANWRVNVQGVPDGHIAIFQGANEVDNMNWAPIYGTANEIGLPSSSSSSILVTQNSFAYALANPFNAQAPPATPKLLPFDDGNGFNTVPQFLAINTGSPSGTVGYATTSTALNQMAMLNSAPAAIALTGTAGTAVCSQSMQGTLTIATCYLNAYQETGTAQTVCFSGSGCTANLAGVNFSAAPNLLASCGTYEPSSTASTLTLPANAAMVAETCNITAIGQ